ncbi:MAG: NADH-quinone oxidoreductase subunit C [Bacteriovoracaceae bacterium]
MGFNWEQYQNLSKVLAHVDGKGYSFHRDQHWVRIRPTQFNKWIQFLHQELNFFQLIDLQASTQSEKLEVFYHLQNIEQHQRLNLVVELFPGETLPSVCATYAAADWMEREIVERLQLPLFGRRVECFFGLGNENDRDLPKIRFNPNRSETPYPEESYQWEYFELTRPELQHLFAAKVCFDNDKITNFIPVLGLHHKGWEKLLSDSLPRQQLGIIDQINLLSAPSYSTLVSKLYEDMSNIKIPERAQAIRMIFIELSRIVEHLTSLGQYCRDLGFTFESTALFSCREKAFELYEKYNGRRNGTYLCRIGGVAQDLPHGWNVELLDFEKLIRKILPMVRNELRSSLVIQEQKNLGQLTAGEAIKWGATGPILRASGINFDLRKSRPIYFYADIEFDIPVGIYGTNYDRLLLRFEEVFESLRIIIQAMDNLPLGDFLLEAEQIESLVAKPQVSSFFTSFEAGQGELGLYYLKHGDVSSIKLRTPSLTNAQSLPHILKSIPRKYLTGTLNLLGLNRTEIDR